MGANPNTLTIQEIWTKQYQISRYKQPVYHAFATERLEAVLKEGAVVHRDYISDLLVNDMGGDGSYSTQAVVDTDETLTVNLKKEVSIQLPKWQNLQTHLPTIEKAGRKMMNALWNKVDSSILKNMTLNAGAIVDDGSIGGTAGNPIVASVGNIQNIFAAVETIFQLANVVYVPNKSFTGNVKKDGGDLMSCAAISANLYSVVTQYVGGKNSAKGDEVTTSGYLGYFMGFNQFVSNNLLWEGQLNLTVLPTDGDSFTLLAGVTVKGVSQALTFTFRTTQGALPGSINITSDAAHQVTSVVASLNAPFTTVAESTDAGYNGFVQASLTLTQQYLLTNATLVASAISTTGVKILVEGMSNVPVSKSMTSAANVWTKQIQHNIFATSQSIDLLMQKYPNIETNPVSGKVALDHIVWNLYGFKVFNDQTPQIVDVQIDASSFTSAPSVVQN